MACATISPVFCPAVKYFSALSHKKRLLKKSFAEHKKRDLTFPTNLTEIILIVTRTGRDVVINVLRINVNYFLFLYILVKFELCRHIFENYSNIKFHENSSFLIRGLPCRRQTD